MARPVRALLTPAQRDLALAPLSRDNSLLRLQYEQLLIARIISQASWRYAPILKSPIDLDVIFNREDKGAEDTEDEEPRSGDRRARWIAKVVRYSTDDNVFKGDTLDQIVVGCSSRLEALETLLERLMGIEDGSR